MTIFEGAAPAAGQTMLAVAVQGATPVVATFPHAHHVDMLKGVERAFNLSRASRTDKAAQQELRENLYVTLMKHQADPAIFRAVVPAIYWLAVNHYDRSQEFKEALSALIRESDRAVVTVVVLGDSSSMRWAFSVGDEVTDLTELFGEIPDSRPFFVSLADDTPAKPLN